MAAIVGGPEPRDLDPAGLRGGVVEIEHPRSCVVGRERQTQQAFLVVPVSDPARDVEEHLGRLHVVAILEHQDPTALLDHEDVVRIARGMGEEERAIELQPWVGEHRRERGDRGRIEGKREPVDRLQRGRLRIHPKPRDGGGFSLATAQERHREQSDQAGTPSESPGDVRDRWLRRRVHVSWPPSAGPPSPSACAWGGWAERG